MALTEEDLEKIGKLIADAIPKIATATATMVKLGASSNA